MNKNQTKLLAEAARYEALAKDAALKAILPFAEHEMRPERLQHGRKAQDHLLRAETFKAAAALMA